MSGFLLRGFEACSGACGMAPPWMFSVGAAFGISGGGGAAACISGGGLGGSAAAFVSLGGVGASAGPTGVSAGFPPPHLAQNFPFAFSCPQAGHVHASGEALGGAASMLLSSGCGAGGSAGATGASTGTGGASSGFPPPHLAQNFPFAFSCPQAGQVQAFGAAGAFSTVPVGVPHFAQNFVPSFNSLPQCLQIFAIESRSCIQINLAEIYGFR
jgi:hypothetical protein